MRLRIRTNDLFLKRGWNWKGENRMKLKYCGFIIFLLCILLIPFASVAEEQSQLPESLKFIGEEAFSGTSLEEVKVPKGIQRIEENAFAFIDGLKAVLFSKGTALQSGQYTVVFERDFSVRNPWTQHDHYFGNNRQFSETAILEGRESNLQFNADPDRESGLCEDGSSQNGIRLAMGRRRAESHLVCPKEKGEIYPINCDFP